MNITPANPYPNNSHSYIKKNTSKDEIFSKVIESKTKDIEKPISTQVSRMGANKGPLGGRWAMVQTGLNQSKIVSINYSESSTPEDPIMTSTDGDTFHINDIDPSNASELEMQMYCAHLDYTGKGTGSTFGTYSDLKTVRMSAHVNGLSSSLGLNLDSRIFKDVKSNWVDLTKKIMSIVKNNDRDLYNSLDKMLNELIK